MFYEQQLQKIKDLIAQEKFEEAYDLIAEELSMPYIPADFEKELLELMDQLPQAVVNGKEISDQEIEEYLKGDVEHQVIAITNLFKKNIRNYLPLCQEYLLGEGDSSCKCLLIYVLMAQEVSSEISCLKDGVQYDFIPNQILAPEVSDGYIKGLEIIEQHFAKNPSLINLAEQLLAQDCLNYLPLTYEEDEAETLAGGIIQEIEKMMNEVIIEKEAQA